MGPGRYEELLAQSLGISVERLRDAQKVARDQMIQEAVQSGRLTQEQADRLKNRQPGQLFDRNFQKFPGPIAAGLRNVFAAAAKAIGITEQQLSEGLRSGKSIAEIADDNNVDRDDLIDEMLDELNAAIDQAQRDGKITAEQATRLKQGLEDHIEKAVDHKGGEGRPFRGGMPGMKPPMQR
jgi:hypothetical protein